MRARQVRSCGAVAVPGLHCGCLRGSAAFRRRDRPGQSGRPVRNGDIDDRISHTDVPNPGRSMATAMAIDCEAAGQCSMKSCPAAERGLRAVRWTKRWTDPRHPISSRHHQRHHHRGRTDYRQRHALSLSTMCPEPVEELSCFDELSAQISLAEAVGRVAAARMGAVGPVGPGERAVRRGPSEGR